MYSIDLIQNESSHIINAHYFTKLIIAYVVYLFKRHGTVVVAAVVVAVVVVVVQFFCM